MATLPKPEKPAPAPRRRIATKPKCVCGHSYRLHLGGGDGIARDCGRCPCVGYAPARSSVLRSPVARKKADMSSLRGAWGVGKPPCRICKHTEAEHHDGADGCSGDGPTKYGCGCNIYEPPVARKSAPAMTKRKLMPKCQCGHSHRRHFLDGTPTSCRRCTCTEYRAKRKVRSDKKPRGMRESDVGKAKRTLWKKFAAYVKARDGNQCFTCDRYAEGGSLQAGHMFPGRTGALLFDPLVVFSQCADCNGGERGRTAVFVDRYIKRFGIEQFQAAVARTSRDKQWRTHEVRELIAAINRGGADYEALYMEKHGLDVAPVTAAARGIE